MSQKLRPDSNVQQTNVVGGYTDINEVTADDAFFVGSISETIGTLVVGLSDPVGTPGSGALTVRYRAAKNGTGTLSVTVALLEGTTVIDTAPAQALTTLFTPYSWTPVLGAANWTNARLRFRFSASASAIGKLSWAEMEVPSPSVKLVANARSLVLTGAAVTLKTPRSLASGAAGFALTGAAAALVKGGKVMPASGAVYALTGAGLALRSAFRTIPAAGAFSLIPANATLGKGIFTLPLSGAFALAGAALAFSQTERSYLFEGRPKPCGSAPRRLLARSDHKCR